MSDATAQPDANLETRPELELTDSTEKDTKGIGYIMNLLGMYGLFFLCMIVIAWFGIFSEV